MRKHTLNEENKYLKNQIEKQQEKIEFYEKKFARLDAETLPKVLLVDDIEANLILLEETLKESIHLNIYKAVSGFEALDLVNKHNFDLIIIDIQMPEMDGYETIEKIKSIEKHSYIPVLLITAVYYEKTYKIKGIESGAIDVITKPFISEILIGKVKTFINLSLNRKGIEQRNFFLKNIIESLTYPFYVINTQTWTIEMANTASGKYESGKTKLNEIFPFKDKSITNIHSEYLKQLAAFKKSGIKEYSYRHSDGKKQFIEVHNYPVCDKNNKVIKIIEYIIDVTNRKVAEYELDKYRLNLEKMVQKRTKELTIAKNRAEESDRLKTAFLTNISHELRTPLNAIMGFSGLLNEQSISSDEKIEFVSHIEESTNQLINFVDDIIQIARIEAGEQKINNFKFNLIDTLEEIYHTYKNKTNNKVELIADFKREEEIIFTDEKLLQQIIKTLIKNAIKFTEKGEVRFGFSKKKDKYLFFVKDTGIGIPEKDQESIFERFRKIEAGNKKIYRGAGLGLTSAKKLLELMGGKIWLESKVNIGTNFFFTLPFQLK